ncbi:hypothetical protein Spb1_03310 [Planctopirus ephydatiae]|jgi:hypothetical protein|uniref:Uncharacterized protein n=1 Tax=Planctopirus ephydatiae TaxID=2528019 RepID=A0A518GIQ8_9PLAN|nr:hypothetical protein Spb1_03310 [Planctopirus ephydatiae]
MINLSIVSSISGILNPCSPLLPFDEDNDLHDVLYGQRFLTQAAFQERGLTMAGMELGFLQCLSC